MDFIAIDVETANADMASICQVGIACYSKGIVTEEWVTLVNPDDYFCPINVSIHGIDEEDVLNAPTFAEISDKITSLLMGNVCVCHTRFDRTSLNQAFSKYNLQMPKFIWLDSARVARRAWEECAWAGYGLANVCKIINYSFKHHDALEDAKACAAILLAAIEKTGIPLNQWCKRITQPLDLEAETGSYISRDGNPQGDHYGTTIAFTGALTILRKEAADLAASIGCKVGGSITKKTNYLVVGDQDISKLAGHNKSLKHRKAEDLILKGQEIRIIKESDFLKLVKCTK